MDNIKCVVFISRMSERLYVTFDKDRQIQSINDLGESMYKESVNDSYGNVCLSPLNMSMVLAMLYTGAGSGTKHLITNMLDARMDDETEVHLHSMFTDLQTEIKKNSKSFCFVNKILMLEFDDVCEKYQNDLQKYYHTTVSLKTFAKTVNDAGDEICDDTLGDTENKLAVRWGFLTSAQICESVNLWTAMKTKERIKNILQEDNIDSENKSMLVISAAYLHSTWQIPFEASTIEKFSSINVEGQEESIYVEMMAVHEYFPVCYLDDAICVKLRYIDDLSLIIVMPTTSLCCLQTIAINNILDHFKTQSATEIRLKLPAFDIDCDLQAESILSSRGISEIFNKSADFTGIAIYAELCYWILVNN